MINYRPNRQRMMGLLGDVQGGVVAQNERRQPGDHEFPDSIFTSVWLGPHVRVEPRITCTLGFKWETPTVIQALSLLHLRGDPKKTTVEITLGEDDGVISSPSARPFHPILWLQLPIKLKANERLRVVLRSFSDDAVLIAPTIGFVDYRVAEEDPKLAEGMEKLTKFLSGLQKGSKS